MTPARQSDSVSTPFLAVFAAVVGLFVAWCGWTASRSYFLGEDFVFIEIGRRAKDWPTWWSTFFPFEPRGWWSYRPISIDLYFHGGFRAFGLDPTGYLLISVAFHLGCGALVYALARAFSLHTAVAAVVAAYAATRFPSLSQLFWASAFQHVAAKFFYLSCVLLFVSALREPRAWKHVASCVALLFGLWSNELTATAPGVLALVAWYERRWPLDVHLPLRGLRAAAPQTGVTVGYLVLRLLVFATPTTNMGALYTPVVGWNIPWNYVAYLGFVVATDTLRVAAPLLLVLLVAGGLAAARRSGEIRSHSIRTALLFLGWAFVVLVPFVGFVTPHHRMAMIVEPPIALLVGVFLDSLLYGDPRVPRAAREAILVLVLVATLPIGLFQRLTTEPLGTTNLQLLDAVESSPDPVRCVELLYGGDGMADQDEAGLVRFRVGNMMKLLRPEAPVTVKLVEQGDTRAESRCLDIVILAGPSLRATGDSRGGP